MNRLTINDITIAWQEIAEHKPGERRQAEKAAVRRLLDALLGPDFCLEHNADGAPVMDGGYLSISHSQRLAVVAVSKTHPIGIDAEEPRDALVRVKTKFLNTKELEWITEPDYLRAWTIKEAVYKTAGIKRLALTDIDIHPSWQLATAATHQFTLHYLSLPPTQITLSEVSNRS